MCIHHSQPSSLPPDHLFRFLLFIHSSESEEWRDCEAIRPHKERYVFFFVCFPKGKKKTKLKHRLEANEAEETASKAAEEGVEETTDEEEQTGDNLVETLEQTRESDEERGEEGDEAACLMISMLAWN